MTRLRVWVLVLACVAGVELRAAGQAGVEADLTERLRAIGARMEAELRRDLEERWYPRAVDRDRGGFHQNFGRDWRPITDNNMFLVYQSRLTWTASAYAAYAPEARGEHGGYAEHGLKCLDEIMRDREGGGYWMILGGDGRLSEALGTEKHAYGLAFVMYAGSTARRVLGSERGLRVAREAFDWLEAHGHDGLHGGYYENFDRAGRVIGREAGVRVSSRRDALGVPHGYKSMNSHLHLLEGVAALAQVDERSVVKERLRELLEVVREKVVSEPGAMHLFFTPEWKPVPGHDSFGHDIEAAYLLVEAAGVLGIPEDARTWQVARGLVDHALELGWDQEHGGFYDTGDAFGPVLDDDKVWWVQAEGLNALWVMHRRYGKETEKYGRALERQWEFIEKHLLDPVHGGWFHEVTREGNMRGDGSKASMWQANYHTSRALMHVARGIRGE